VLVAILLCFFVDICPLWAAGQPTIGEDDDLWFEVTPDGDIEVRLYFFWSETCPHCARAQPVIKRLTDERPWLEIRSYEVSASPANREIFALLARSAGEEIRGVPAFFVCGVMLVGFDNELGMGQTLAALSDRCRMRMGEELSPVREPNRTSPSEVEVPVLGQVDLSGLSLPFTTLILGALDAFNPCAFFVLMFLLSLMVHSRSRGRMALIGGIFVMFSGLLYFAFMAAWLNLYLMLEGLQTVTLIAGGVAICFGLINIKDFFQFKQGISLSISERARPGLFARMRNLLSVKSLPTMLTATVTLAAVANSYELLCTSGFPLIYTRILTMRELETGKYYLYLVLYNVVYILPLLSIVIVFTLTLGNRKLSELEGRALKLLSGLMMFGLGSVLVFAPSLLDNLLTAFVLVILAIVATIGLVVIDRNRRRSVP
jgi:hypothetical protein